MLDQRILPLLRNEMRGLGQSHIKVDTDQDIPSSVHYLIVAAYICQSNNPDRDKRLFVIQKNGRRSNRKTEEEISDQTKSRSFPAERLYSIYVSISHLHGNQKTPGSLEFNENIRSFQAMGILKETRLKNPILFMSCISREEANSSAKVAGVPLENYVVS